MLVFLLSIKNSFGSCPRLRAAVFMSSLTNKAVVYLTWRCLLCVISMLSLEWIYMAELVLFSEIES